MNIAYFNYSGGCLPVHLQSFELARAAAAVPGCNITLHLLHERIQLPEWFFSMIEHAVSDNFKIFCRKPNGPPEPAGTRPRRSGSLTTTGQIGTIAKSLRFVPRELKIIRSQKPDVVAVRPDYSFSFRISCMLLSVPLVLVTDGPAEELAALHQYAARWPVAFDAWRARHAAAITVISETCRQLWLDKKIEPSRLFLCPNGADPEVFKPLPPDRRRALRAALGFPESAVVIGFAGNQQFWHGLRLLAGAFVALARRDRRLHLLVAGSLEGKAASGLDSVPASLAGRVRTTGPLDYALMPEYMDCMDLFVMPYPRFSLFHFSPMKMFEALAMGKVIVASAQGQITELLAGLPSAFLYNPDDESGLREALVRALAALESSPGLGAFSRAAGREKHTWRQRGEVLAAACRLAYNS
jgi:glycosyltransferase involved in cell wall biosynthesis